MLYVCMHAAGASAAAQFVTVSADRHIRLDYAFVPAAFASRLTACRVVADNSEAAAASDHLPLLIEW